MSALTDMLPIDQLPIVALGFTTPAAESTTFRVARAHVYEGLSALYSVQVDVATEADRFQVRPDALLGAPAALTVSLGHLERHVAGVIQAIENLGTAGEQRRLRATVVPSLWHLSQRSNYRIYQDVDAVEIVLDVLRDAGIYQRGGKLKQNLRPSYPKREYCVQFGETDLEFVQRLLAEEGIAYYFEHEGTSETLVLHDGTNNTAWPQIQTLDGGAVRVLSSESGTTLETVRRFDWHRRLGVAGVTLRDFNFTNPTATEDMTRLGGSASAAAGDVVRALYTWPGRYTIGSYNEDGHAYTSHDGPRLAQVRHESHAIDTQIGHASSNVTGLVPGMTFDLSGHDSADLDQRYLVTEVSHMLHAPDVQGQAAECDTAINGDDRYANTFTCVPASAVYRPQLPPRTPRLQGPQTATVMAEPGSDDEICTDFHGRILVRFHWDRPDQRSASQRSKKSSVWLRVAQTWAGQQWGFSFIPRVGMEVLVNFLDGDPDRPLVTGCVYNGTHTQPVALPNEKTKSIIRTHSTPGGRGFNELSFEDSAQHEKVYLRAQKDHEILVQHDQTSTIQHDRTTTIEHDDVLTVQGDRRVAVRGETGLTVSVDHHHRLYAHDSIELVCGQSSIVMYPDRITLSSPKIEELGEQIIKIKGGVVKINCDD